MPYNGETVHRIAEAYRAEARIEDRRQFLTVYMPRIRAYAEMRGHRPEATPQQRRKHDH